MYKHDKRSISCHYWVLFNSTSSNRQ